MTFLSSFPGYKAKDIREIRYTLARELHVFISGKERSYDFFYLHSRLVQEAKREAAMNFN